MRAVHEGLSQGQRIVTTRAQQVRRVAALRKKIEDDLDHPAYILSVRNVGYRFNQTPTPS